MTIILKKVSDTRSFGVAAWAMAAALLAVSPVHSQPLTTSADTVVSDMTVVGKVKPRSRLRTVPGFNANSASSCNFGSGAAALTHIQGYYQAMGYSGDSLSPTVDLYAPQSAEFERRLEEAANFNRRGSRQRRISISPYPNASSSYGGSYGSYGSGSFYDGPSSSFGSSFSSFGSSFHAFGNDPCARAASLLAGRAEIILNDKTLPQARALFRAGKYAEALEMFRKAERKLPIAVGVGGDEAALMIGKMSLYGLGTQVDLAEARRYLDRAAYASIDITTQLPAFDPKNPDDSLMFTSEAAVILADLYLTGGDAPRARALLRRANLAGYVPAAKMLGDLYYNGRGTPRDYRTAARYYGQAAKLGYAPAQDALGDLYYSGEGVAQNLGKALAWYNAAAKLEHPDALYALAVAYDTGEGVAVDQQKAIGLYKIAAINGSADAQSAIGSSFYEGGILPKDPATARKWFEAAAARGQSDAMFNLAAMQMRGEGGEQDLVKAWAWLKLAEAKGHPNAAPALSVLESRMSPAQRATAAELVAPKKVS